MREHMMLSYTELDHHLISKMSTLASGCSTYRDASNHGLFDSFNWSFQGLNLGPSAFKADTVQKGHRLVRSYRGSFLCVSLQETIKHPFKF